MFLRKEAEDRDLNLPEKKVISKRVKNRDFFLKNFQHYIRAYGKVVIFIHNDPDGDCIGSAFGLKAALKSKFPENEVYVLGSSEGKFPWLKMEFDTLPGDFDYSTAISVIVDVGNSARIQRFQEHFRNLIGKKWGAVLRIDHHDSLSDFYLDLSWVDPSYVSTSAQIIQIIDYYGWEMTPISSTFLYLGLLTDSGFFSHSSISPRSLILGAKALRGGADHSFLSENLKRIPSEALKLKERMYSGYVQENGFLWFHINRELYLEFQSCIPLLDLPNVLGYIGSNVAWFLFTDLPDGRVKASFRSCGALDVMRLAEEFGGGGHRNAAGTILQKVEFISGVISRAREYISEYLKLKKVGMRFEDYMDESYLSSDRVDCCRLGLNFEEMKSISESKRILEEMGHRIDEENRLLFEEEADDEKKGGFEKIVDSSEESIPWSHGLKSEDDEEYNEMDLEAEGKKEEKVVSGENGEDEMEKPEIYTHSEIASELDNLNKVDDSGEEGEDVIEEIVEGEPKIKKKIRLRIWAFVKRVFWYFVKFFVIPVLHEEEAKLEFKASLELEDKQSGTLKVEGEGEKSEGEKEDKGE